MTDLRDRLSELEQLDAPDMRSAIDQRVAELQSTPPAAFDLAPRTPWRGPLIAIATAVAVLVVAVATVLLLRGGSSTVEPAETVPTPIVTTVPSTPPPADLSNEAAFTLVPAAGVDPVEISTVFGDFEFVTMKLPPGRDLDFFAGLAATPHGPVAVTHDEAKWWSEDYETWQKIPIDGDTGRIDVVGSDVVVSSRRTMTRLVWDGDQWNTAEQIEFPGLGTIDHLAFGPRGAVAANLTTVYYSVDGTTFVEAERGPDLSAFVASDQNPEDEEYVEAARMDCRGTYGAERSLIRSVVATDAGFVAFTSASHLADAVCAPLLWFSPDGNMWELVSSESPFGQLTEINTHSIAEHAGRFVAIGGVESEERGFVWVSDDAVTWRRADLVLAAPLTVDAGELGWVLTGAPSLPTESADFGLWFSTDGYTWDGPHPLPDGLLGGYFIPQMVVGADTVVGLGMQEQVFVIGRPAEGAATP